MYEVNQVLVTRYPQRLSNAVITKISQDGITVLSDFGNLMLLSSESVNSAYEVSNNWREYKALDYPFEPLDERIRLQIARLEDALKNL